MENKFHKENIFVIKNCWKDDIFSTKLGNETKLRKEDWCSTTRTRQPFQKKLGSLIQPNSTLLSINLMAKVNDVTPTYGFTALYKDCLYF